MPYLLIEDFRAGLDARKFRLALPAGTLTTLKNAHITSGAEIEKRKAFVRTARPAGTFGLEATDAGLITFGSAADPGGWPIGGVSAYQRLQHPAVLNGATFDAQYHAMTKVTFSQPFKGAAFVVAVFADGRSFLYYAGSLVKQSAYGLVLPGFANQAAIQNAQGGNLKTLFDNLDGWLTRFLGTYTFDPNGGPVVFVATPGSVSTVASVVTKVTTSGLLPFVTGAGISTTAGLAGTASFTVNGAPGSDYTLYAPLTPNSSERVTLMGVDSSNVTVDWAVSNNATATAIAAAVNAHTVNHGFSAGAVGAVVTISSPIQAGTALLQTPFSWGNLQVIATADAANGNHAFANGYDTIPAIGKWLYYGFGGTWAVGDSWTVSVSVAGTDYTFGKGNIAGQTPTCGLTFGDRVYMGIGGQFNFSAVADPTGWESQDLGAGFISYTSQYGALDAVNGFAPYQGKLATIGRRTTQIWQTDSDPDNFALAQTLDNIGTFAPLTVKSVGDFDTIMLADTGFRSLRVRDSSGNAIIADVGVPVDKLVQALLATLTDAEKSVSCSIFEPSTNTYWGFIPGHSGAEGTIYVYSYFPSSQVAAWSTYRPTYANGNAYKVINNTALSKEYWLGLENDYTKALLHFTLSPGAEQSLNFRYNYIWTAAVGFAPPVTTTIAAEFVGTMSNTGPTAFTFTAGQTAFEPQKFVVFNGRVYACSSDAFFLYGGTDNATYDNCRVQWDSPFMSARTPATRKDFTGINCGLEGYWTVSIGTNTASDTDVKAAYLNNESSWQLPAMPVNRKSTHIKLRGEEYSSGYALFSSTAIHFQGNEEKN